MSGAYRLCFQARSGWRDIDDRCHCCHCWDSPVSGMLKIMTLLIVFGAMLVVLTIAALAGKVPDTHREVSQHGDFEF